MTFCLTLLLAGSYLPLVAAERQAVPPKPLNPAKRPAVARKPAATPRKPRVVLPARTTAQAVLAPQLVTVRGMVLGPNSLALPGASVFPAGRPDQAVVTNQDGEFELRLPSAAQLIVSYAGLADSRLQVPARSFNALFVTLQSKRLGNNTAANAAY